MREFKLYRSYATVIFVVVGPIAAIVFAVALALAAVGASGLAAAGPGAIILSAFLLLGALFILRLPTRIRQHDDGSIEFIGPLRRTRVAASAISSIRSSSILFGYLSVSFEGRSLLLLPSFDGFHEFLAYVKQANKWVELRGC